MTFVVVHFVSIDRGCPEVSQSAHSQQNDSLFVFFRFSLPNVVIYSANPLLVSVSPYFQLVIGEEKIATKGLVSLIFAHEGMDLCATPEAKNVGNSIVPKWLEFVKFVLPFLQSLLKNRLQFHFHC